MDCVLFLKSLTQGTDFERGFLVFGRLSQVFNTLLLVLMLCLGFKFLQVSLPGKGLVHFFCYIRGKSGERRNGLCSNIDFGEEFDANIVSGKCGPPWKLLDESNSKSTNDVSESVECCEEDELSDVESLRKLVKMEMQRANVACMELEKERTAAASAAEEAMAMILRLQSEKSSAEIEANRFRRMAEQKQEHDEEVIQSLQWIVMRHESEKSLLEEKLKIYEKKLKQFVKEDFEMDEFEGVDTAEMFE
ncbi:protein FLOURY 1-like [Mangifera indica]|uniref:protein FLOURY 1-like n=1 Tax=Mangifera indica TaxID=29780 RepID=UPI001CFB63A9|nr:protein FLOURY 1-like [Mangifera indica]